MWNEKLDGKLLNLKAEGLSFAEVGERLGITRNAAIGRFQRLNGRKFQSQVLREATAKQASVERKQEAERLRRKTVSKIKREVAAGKDRSDIITRALNEGATYQTVGDGLGVSKQRIHQIVS